MSKNVPIIVAQVASTGLSQSTSQSITLYNVPADGMFRVSIYASCSSSAAVLAPFNLAFTDGNGSLNSFIGNAYASSGEFFNSGSGVPVGSISYIRAVNGTSIVLNISANPGGPSFDLYATVEEL